MKYKINLLEQKTAPLTERVMYFALNYLRYIIIITQLVVIGVFFYRFQIDQKIIDLKESVEQKKEILQVVLPLLKEAELIDRRSTEAQKIIASQDQSNAMMQYFLSVFPADTSLSSLNMDQAGIKAVGSTTNPEHFQAFYNLLKRENKFGTVELQSMQKTPTGFEFTLTVGDFKQG